MNSKKSKSKISSELKTLKLPYFKCEHVTDKLDAAALQALFLKSFESKYKKYIAAVAGNAQGVGAAAEKMEIVAGNYTDFIADGGAKTVLPIVYASNFRFEDLATLKLINLQEYISRLHQSVRYIFDMPRLENQLEMIIDSIDRPNLENKLKYYRYMKLQRMKKFHELVVDFFLSLLHNYYWLSFVEKKENYNNVDYYIGRIIPIVHHLHQSLISELNFEFPIDEIEKNFSKF